jgi:hypothetical protein
MIVLVGAVAVLASLLIVWGTQPLGPGLYGDGAAYMSAAESLVHSGRLRVIGAPYWSADSTMPMAQWPPGFVFAVAVPLRAGLGSLAAVNVIQVLAAAVTVVLTAVLVGRALSPAWGVVAAVAVIATPAVLGVQLNIVSEPLYIAGLTILLLTVTRWPDRVGVSGVMAAALVMIRYLGLAAIAGAGFCALMRSGPPLRRLGRLVLAAGPGIGAYAGWVAFARARGGAIQQVIWDPDVGGILRRLIGATEAWLAPFATGPAWVRVAIKLVIVALAVGAAITAARSRPTTRPEGHGSIARREAESRTGARDLVVAACIFVACHLAVLFTARLVDASVEFTPRTYAPVHYLLTIAAVTSVGAIWMSVPRARLLAMAAAGTWLVASATATVQLLQYSRTVGLDHARPEERDSPTLAWLRVHGNARPIYTNEPAKIYFHVHRQSRSLPWVVTGDTLHHLNDALRERPGYVVWFLAGRAADFVPPPMLPQAMSAEKLQASVALAKVAEFPDGLIWLPDSAATATSKQGR